MKGLSQPDSFAETKMAFNNEKKSHRPQSDVKYFRE
jgi:hypothetical protein